MRYRDHIVAIHPPAARERSRHTRPTGRRIERATSARCVATLVAVSVPRQVVDYALQRRASIADVAAGRVTPEDACDAGFYLLQAAAHHGRPTTTPCPLCRAEDLVQVSWIFGDRLGAAAGSARSAEEIERLAEAIPEFTVHVVEVCRACRWNHLVQSYVLGTGDVHGGGRRRRRTAST